MIQSPPIQEQGTPGNPESIRIVNNYVRSRPTREKNLKVKKELFSPAGPTDDQIKEEPSASCSTGDAVCGDFVLVRFDDVYYAGYLMNITSDQVLNLF